MKAAFARILALVLILGLAAPLALVMLFEESLIYAPSRELEARPSDLGLEADEVFLETSDSVRIHAWFLPAGESSEGGTVLYCHGNAGNISTRLWRVAQMHLELGVDVLLFDYRGYGLSDGSPDEEGTYRDARTAYRYLTETRGVPPDAILLYGESLGAAVALALANEVPSQAVVLEAPFTSIADMARAVFPFLPVGPFLRTRYDNVSGVRSLRVPLLIVHGTEDRTVPYEQGRRLFEAAPEPKRFLSVPGGGHSDAPVVAGELYWDAWRELIRSSTAR